MTDEKPPEPKAEPMTDEAIDNLVKFVESAETFATTMGLKSPSVGAYMMLKATQTMALAQAGRAPFTKLAFEGLFPKLGKKTVQ